MSPANEQMLDVMRYVAAVGADVQASILLDPTPVRAQQIAIFRFNLGEGNAFPHG